MLLPTGENEEENQKIAANLLLQETHIYATTAYDELQAKLSFLDTLGDADYEAIVRPVIQKYDNLKKQLEQDEHQDFTTQTIIISSVRARLLGEDDFLCVSLHLCNDSSCDGSSVQIQVLYVLMVKCFSKLSMMTTPAVEEEENEEVEEIEPKDEAEI
ncbi:hypothetical protein Tco_1047314 [Tanacetum coccineum]